MYPPNYLTVEEFIKEINGQLKVYAINMKHSKAEPRSFAEWYEDFTYGTMIGTEYEEEMYGPRREKNDC